MAHQYYTNSNGMQHIEDSGTPGVPITTAAGAAGAANLSNFVVIDNRASTLETRNSIKNVKEFGAVGNGTTDDTTAIQAAVDYCTIKASGTSLFFPQGRYLVSSTITINNVAGFSMFGDSGGWATVDDVLSGLGVDNYIRSAILWNGATSGTIFNLYRSNRFHIEDLLVSGTASGNDSTKAGICFHIQSAPGFAAGEHIFNNVQVINSYVGFQMGSGTTDINCADCSFYNCKISTDKGIYVKTNQGVDYYLYNVYFGGTNITGLHFERGGQLRWYGGGGTIGGASTLLKIDNPDNYNASFYVNGLFVEQNNNYPVWVDCSGALSTGNIVFEGCADTASNLSNPVNPVPGLAKVGPHTHVSFKSCVIHRHIANMYANASDADASLLVEDCTLSNSLEDLISINGTNPTYQLYNRFAGVNNNFVYSGKQIPNESSEFKRLLLTLGCKGYYPMDEYDGTVATDYGLSRVSGVSNGTYGVYSLDSSAFYESTTVFDQVPGHRAMTFTSGYMQPAIVTGSQNSLYYGVGTNSIGVWFNQSASGDATLISTYVDASGTNQNGYWLGLENNLLKLKLVRATSTYQELAGTETIQPNMWYFAMFTRASGVSTKLYLNGDLVDSDADFNTGDGVMPRVAHASGIANKQFSGKMAHLMGFGAVTGTGGIELKPREVKQIYEFGSKLKF